MKLLNSGALSCAVLYEQFQQQAIKPSAAEKIVFSGVGERDVYNIAAPFEHQGRLVIAGRVESRDSEASEVHFFVQEDGVWVPLAGAPIFTLQDPFHTTIGGQLVLGGVETFPHPEIADALSWRTVFYKGTSLNNLTLFFTGPDQMKDLRLVEQQDGTIGVFTRPQGEKGGRGKIGYTQVPSLDQLTIDVVDQAPLLSPQFLDDEWGGCNEIHLLSNGYLGALSHIAYFDERGDRHYYATAFVVDPVTNSFSNLEIIAERANFLDGPSKRDDLQDVVFSGGLVRQADGTATLYAGTSDAEAQKVTIVDPFVKYESM